MSETLFESLSQSIDDKPTDTIAIETDGRLIRPLLAVPAVLVNEAKFIFDDSGLMTRGVDAANVGMYRLDVPADAFDAYDGGDVSVGVNIDTLRSKVRGARLGKRTADPVSLEFASSHTGISIEREYADTVVRRNDEVRNLDPDSLREMPTVPDLDLSWRAEIEPQAFVDAIGHIGGEYDHISIGERDGDLVCAGVNKNEDKKILQSSSAEFDGAVEAATDEPTAGAMSKFSADYLTDMAAAISDAKIDTMSVLFGDEFPVIIDFERTDADGETVYEGQFMQAPRIQR